MLKTNKYARDNRKLTIIILKNMLKMEMKMQKNVKNNKNNDNNDVKKKQ